MLTSLRQNSGSILFAGFLSISLWLYVNMKAITTQIVRYPVVVSAEPGKAIASDYPSNIDVKVRTNGWHLFNLEYIGAARICNVRTESGTSDANGMVHFTKNEILQSLIPNLSLEKIIDVTPEAFSVHLSTLVTKKVPVKPSITLGFKDNYGLVNRLDVTPDSVVLSGSEASLERIREWRTSPISLQNLYSNFTVAARASDTLQPLIECLTPDIQISGTVDEIIEIEITDIPVIIRNAPNKRTEHTVMPLLISAVVRGGLKTLSRLSTSDFVASLEYSTIVNDSTGYVRPTISTPYSVEVIATKPKVLTHKRQLGSTSLTLSAGNTSH